MIGIREAGTQSAAVDHRGAEARAVPQIGSAGRPGQDLGMIRVDIMGHAQVLTGSAGASYLWNGTRFSTSMIYGSGLRSGFANTDHLPSYTQVNVGLSHDFNIVSPTKPTTLRFDVVNLFDKIYEIRDGSGIGVFAPQFGPRRGFYF